MTTGTIPFGSTTSVSTDAGPGTTFFHFGSKTWSGGNASKPSVSQRKTRSRYTRIKVYDSKGKYTWVKWRNPLPEPSTRPKLAKRPPNAYNMVYTTRTDLVGAYWNATQQKWKSCTGANSGYGACNVIFASTMVELQNKTVDRMRDRVAGSDFNLGVFLGEGKEALSMIANAATGIHRMYRAVKRGNFQVAAAYLRDANLANGRELGHNFERQILQRTSSKKKNLAQRQLELSYGWLPLVHDVQAAAVYLAEMREFGRKQTYRSSAKCGGELRPVFQPYPGWTNVTGNIRRSVKLIANVSSIDEPTLSGLADPLSVAWELMPWSFVADWFFPVGDYLNRLALARAIQGTFIRTSYEIYDWKANDFTVNPGPLIWQGCQTQQKRLEVKRELFTSLPVNPPQVQNLNEAYSWRRAVNAVSLLVARWGS